MVCLICAYKWMRMYPGTGRFLYVLFFSFSWELGNVLLIKSQSGKGVAQFGDFHEWGFLSCLALNSRFYTSSTGGDYGVTSGYLKDRLDPWGTKGKFWGLPLGVLSPLGTRGGRKELGPESELDLLFTCGIHSWLQEVLASPQLPVGALSRQVRGRSSFQAVSDSLGSIRGIYIININRLWHVLVTKLLI